jgi:hypothetical protein
MTVAAHTLKPVLDFNKDAFDSGFNTMLSIGDHQEKVFHAMMDQSAMPEEGRDIFLQWTEFYRSRLVDFKKAADAGYHTILSSIEASSQAGRSPGQSEAAGSGAKDAGSKEKEPAEKGGKAAGKGEAAAKKAKESVEE